MSNASSELAYLEGCHCVHVTTDVAKRFRVDATTSLVMYPPAVRRLGVRRSFEEVLDVSRRGLHAAVLPQIEHHGPQVADCRHAVVVSDGDDLFGELLFSDELSDAPPPQQDSRAKALRSKRNSFKTHAAPTSPMSAVARGWQPQQTETEPPDAIRPFVEWFYGQPDARERFRWALRDSLDELLDGQRTGRWCYQQLSKTEKTYLGTAVEVNLTKEFAIPNGEDLDWRVAGADLDCKFSKDLGGWEIPMEMYRCEDHGDRTGKMDHPALLVWLSDDKSQWAAGVVTITDDRLKWKQPKVGADVVRAYNRDNKRKLAEASAREVFWFWGGLQDDLPTNLLLHLSEEVRARILTSNSGQERINQLFREVSERLVGRQTVLTVGQQDDSPKRARDSRLDLRDEGLVVLGHSGSHPIVAEVLGLPTPVKGEWISTRLTQLDADDPRPAFILDGSHWGRATKNDVVVPAPDLKPNRAVQLRH